MERTRFFARLEVVTNQRPAEVAELAGISLARYAKIKAEETDPHSGEISRLAAAFGLDVPLLCIGLVDVSDLPDTPKHRRELYQDMIPFIRRLAIWVAGTHEPQDSP